MKGGQRDPQTDVRVGGSKFVDHDQIRPQQTVDLWEKVIREALMEPS